MKQKIGGVGKRMPMLSAGRDRGTNFCGIQAFRVRESYSMNESLKAPFPWPGGKSDIAPAVWARFGQPDNFVEAFAGSSAMLLARPGGAHATETVNDLDGLLINAYRAITYAPDETAAWCDWPVSEADLTSRHLYLKAAREELTQRLFGDPFYCDPLLGAWWLWGIASWIGDGWCVSDGPWIAVDGRLVDRRVVGEDTEGVARKMPLVGAVGVNRPSGANENLPGIHRYRAAGVPRKMPQVAADPRSNGSANRAGVQAVRYGVPKQMPVVSARGDLGGTVKQGVNSYAEPSALSAYFARLSDRLRRVRFLCGDWRRACKDSVTVNHGLTAVFLDPPYPPAEHDMRYHGDDDVWHAAAQWAIEHGDDKRLRIAIAGYHSEATDALFPPTWERYRWEARGGYANQKADGRGRANAKRECCWFSPHCIDRATDYGPLFAQEDV